MTSHPQYPAPVPNGAVPTFMPQRPAWMRPSVEFVESLRVWRKNIWVFNGRASRSEYWWMYLWLQLVLAAVSIVITLIFGTVMVAMISSTSRSDTGGAHPGQAAVIIGLIALMGLIPFVLELLMLGLRVRRLHDANFSGWWIAGEIALFGLFLIGMGIAMIQSIAAGDDSSSVPVLTLMFFVQAVAFAYFVFMLVVTILPSNPKGVRFDDPHQRLPFPQSEPAVA